MRLSWLTITLECTFSGAFGTSASFGKEVHRSLTSDSEVLSLLSDFFHLRTVRVPGTLLVGRFLLRKFLLEIIHQRASPADTGPIRISLENLPNETVLFPN